MIYDDRQANNLCFLVLLFKLGTGHSLVYHGPKNCVDFKILQKNAGDPVNDPKSYPVNEPVFRESSHTM